jgi:hypothetical protein
VQERCPLVHRLADHRQLAGQDGASDEELARSARACVASPSRRSVRPITARVGCSGPGDESRRIRSALGQFEPDVECGPSTRTGLEGGMPREGVSLLVISRYPRSGQGSARPEQSVLGSGIGFRGGERRPVDLGRPCGGTNSALGRWLRRLEVVRGGFVLSAERRVRHTPGGGIGCVGAGPRSFESSVRGRRRGGAWARDGFLKYAYQ